MPNESEDAKIDADFFCAGQIGMQQVKSDMSAQHRYSEPDGGAVTESNRLSVAAGAGHGGDWPREPRERRTRDCGWWIGRAEGHDINAGDEKDEANGRKQNEKQGFYIADHLLFERTEGCADAMICVRVGDGRLRATCSRSARASPAVTPGLRRPMP